jgi:hypothetical protein
MKFPDMTQSPRPAGIKHCKAHNFDYIKSCPLCERSPYMWRQRTRKYRQTETIVEQALETTKGNE